MVSAKPEVSFYRLAKESVLACGYSTEVDRQRQQDFRSFSETELLRESAWVILCSGFKEAVVRQHFDFISLCFLDWQSASEICACAAQCKATALACFSNRRKIEAILSTAQVVNQYGFQGIKSLILHDPIQSLQIFPFIGPITAHHLAKNLGYATAKPDRHLVRLAFSWGYANVQHMCNLISVETGDPIQVVDVVLWRYSVLNKKVGKNLRSNCELRRVADA